DETHGQYLRVEVGRPARCGRGGASARGRHQREPSGAAPTADDTAVARTANASARRAGTSATSPPRAMTAVAIQIQPTIGFTRASSPTVPEAGSMFWIDR